MRPIGFIILLAIAFLIGLIGTVAASRVLITARASLPAAPATAPVDGPATPQAALLPTIEC